MNATVADNVNQPAADSKINNLKPIKHVRLIGLFLTLNSLCSLLVFGIYPLLRLAQGKEAHYFPAMVAIVIMSLAWGLAGLIGGQKANQSIRNFLANGVLSVPITLGVGTVLALGYGAIATIAGAH